MKWFDEGHEFMKSGGSLVDFKEKMRGRGASDNSVIYVSEKLLNAQFDRTLNKGLMGGFFGQLMALFLIMGGCFLAYWLWNHSDAYFIVSTIPFVMIMFGIKMLSNP